MTNLVMVYGTLKRGQRNAHYLRDAKFIGEARTLDHFDMLDVGFPVILPQKQETAFPVYGELYEVSDNELISLDRLEGEGRMYQRQVRAVLTLKGKEVKQVYLYVGIPGERWHYARPVEPTHRAYIWQPQIMEEEDYDDEEEA